jgi:hypothetical protein
MEYKKLKALVLRYIFEQFLDRIIYSKTMTNRNPFNCNNLGTPLCSILSFLSTEKSVLEFSRHLKENTIPYHYKDLLVNAV